MGQRDDGVAVITGATGGLGQAFAKALAAEGRPLLLVGRNADALEAQAGQLRDRYRGEVQTAITDLSDPPAVVRLAEQLRTIEVGLLINNAGFGLYGPYEQLDSARQHDQLQVLVVALADLSLAVAPQLVRRGYGGMINIASTAGFQPTPYLSGYAAAKAFVLSFSQALHAELSSKGVQVTALCPGPVLNGFWESIGSTDGAFGQHLSAERVVSDGLAGFRRGKPVVVPGARNWATAQANRFIPRRLAVAVTAALVRPRG